MTTPWSTFLSLTRPVRPQPATDDNVLLTALRAGDERAFEELVRRYHGPLIKIALMYVRDRAVAEEVVQETWLAALGGSIASRGARR
jgi:DNA-directed RNA polymerase specialized sigma24 family protein